MRVTITFRDDEFNLHLTHDKTHTHTFHDFSKTHSKTHIHRLNRLNDGCCFLFCFFAWCCQFPRSVNIYATNGKVNEIIELQVKTQEATTCSLWSFLCFHFPHFISGNCFSQILFFWMPKNALFSMLCMCDEWIVKRYTSRAQQKKKCSCCLRMVFSAISWIPEAHETVSFMKKNVCLFCSVVTKTFLCFFNLPRNEIKRNTFQLLLSVSLVSCVVLTCFFSHKCTHN